MQFNLGFKSLGSVQMMIQLPACLPVSAEIPPTLHIDIKLIYYTCS